MFREGWLRRNENLAAKLGVEPPPEPLSHHLTQMPLILGADGVMVPLRPHLGKPHGKTIWREVKVAILVRLGRRFTRTGKDICQLHHRRLVAVLGDIETLRPRLLSDLSAEFGNLRRAFQVILQATDPKEWEAIAEKRRKDLLVYLALGQFSRRPKLGDLAVVVQEDIKALFGTYKQACAIADQMLFSLGDSNIILNCCQNSSVGKKLPNSLLIHVCAVEALDPLLRLYEGCASRTIGRLEQATLIKFHTKTPKISYLVYPDFDTDPHPTLHTTMQIDLRDLHVSYRDYDTDDDPPVLHQKDALVTPDYPGTSEESRGAREQGGQIHEPSL